MQLAAVIVAGGTGTRMGTDIPKQLLPLDGRPILLRTVEKWLNYNPDLKVVLVLHPDIFPMWEEIAQQFLKQAEQGRIQLAPGGDTRTRSVENGLKALCRSVTDSQNCLVAIHDGVRPFVTTGMIAEAYDLAARHGAAVACVPVKSSLRRLTGQGSEAVDRRPFYHVQTPQTFRLSAILEAFEKRPHNDFTDDASLFEAAGGKVMISAGSYDNLKITTPEDIVIGEGILRRDGKN